MDFACPQFHNLEYYENVPPQELQRLSIDSGLEQHPDLEMIYPFIKDAQNILEIGGGYGRAIDFFTKNNFKGHIDILEPTDNFFKVLKSKYPTRFNIYKEFIQTFIPTKKYDVALWLWSNIIEFDPPALEKILKKLKDATYKHGLLVIETIHEHLDPLGLEEKTNDSALLDLKYGFLKIFNYSKCDLINFAEASGFKTIEVTDYQLSSGRSRTLFLFAQTDTAI
jgi:hypothetical protein